MCRVISARIFDAGAVPHAGDESCQRPIHSLGTVREPERVIITEYTIHWPIVSEQRDRTHLESPSRGHHNSCVSWVERASFIRTTHGLESVGGRHVEGMDKWQTEVERQRRGFKGFDSFAAFAFIPGPTSELSIADEPQVVFLYRPEVIASSYRRSFSSRCQIFVRISVTRTVS